MTPLFLLTTFRSESNGTDTSMYVERYYVLAEFEWDKFINFLDYDSRTEFGYALIAKITSVFSDSHILFFGIIAFMTYSAFSYYIYKLSCNIWMSMIIYYALLISFSPMNTMRQDLAIAIFCFVFSLYIYNSSTFFYLVGTLVSGLFHNVAFVMLPFVFLNRKNLGWYRNIKMLLIIIFFISIGVYMITIMFFDLLTQLSIYADYLDSKFTDGSVSQGLSPTVAIIRNSVVYFMPAILLMLGLKNNVYKGAEVKLAFYSVLFMVLTGVFNIAGYSITILLRIAMAFNYFTCISFPLAIKYFGDKKYTLKYTIVCIWIFYFILNVLSQFSNGQMVEYNLSNAL